MGSAPTELDQVLGIDVFDEAYFKSSTKDYLSLSVCTYAVNTYSLLTQKCFDSCCCWSLMRIYILYHLIIA